MRIIANPRIVHKLWQAYDQNKIQYKIDFEFNKFYR